MPQRYVTTVGNKKVLASFIEEPSGGSDASKPVAINPVTGKIHAAFVPDSTSPVRTFIASEVIANRRFVNTHTVSSNPRIRTSLGTYDRRVFGHVETGGNANDTLNVQTGGEVTMDIGSTGVVIADINAPVFADPTNAGMATKTAPSTSGQARQYLGVIAGVNTGTGTFTIALALEEAEELV